MSIFRMSLVVYTLVAAFLIYFIPKLYKYYRQIRTFYEYDAHIPGLSSVWPIGSVLQVPSDTGEHSKYFIDLANKYTSEGHSLMKIWIGDRMKVMPLNGESVKDILDNSTEIVKGDDYDFIIPWLGYGLLIATGDKWRSRRKLLTPTFHFQMLDGYVDTFNKQAKVLVDLLDNFVDHTRPVDVFPFLKRCALDIIYETAMGYKLKCQIDQSNIFARTVDNVTHLMSEYTFKAYLWVKPIWILLGYESVFKSYLETLDNMTKSVIKDRQQKRLTEKADTSGKRKAFLDMLLDLKEQNLLTDAALEDEVNTFTFGGYDTTSTAMSWLLWMLATHPEIQEKVYDELKANLGDDERDIEVSDLKNLPYLEMVIKESLRLNPTIPFVSRKLVNDTKIGGYKCPANAQVLISPLMIHHNEQVWKDHLKFDPDRFLPEQVAQRNTYDFIPFSAGPRNCIGQKFAQYEEKIVISWIIRRFRIRGHGDLELNDRVSEVVLKPKKGIPLYFERRKPIEEST